MIIAYPNPPEVKVTETFGVDSISVTLNWTQENDLSYDLTIAPYTTVHSMFLYNNAVIELVALYNNVYNVTITTSFCGLNNATSVIQLYYGEYQWLLCKFYALLSDSNIQLTVVIYLK